DAGRGEQHLGERGEIEPGALLHRPAMRHRLRRAGHANRAVSGSIDDTQHTTGNSAGTDRGVHQLEGVVEGSIEAHADSLSGRLTDTAVIAQSGAGAYDKGPERAPCAVAEGRN